MCSSDLLEGQVEARLGEVADVTHLRVQFHHPVADVHLAEGGGGKGRGDVLICS